MVVDIGGGTTDIAVISLSGIVYSRSLRVAGNQMDDAIMEYVKKKYNLLIGERTAEAIKMQIGSAFPLANEMRMEVRGRDLLRGLPGVVTLTDSEIRDALAICVASIVDAIKVALEHTPPELSAARMQSWVMLSISTGSLGATASAARAAGLAGRSPASDRARAAARSRRIASAY